MVRSPAIANRRSSPVVIARLPFRQRAVIVMRYHADLSESEIAEALDCRRGTVKSLASRITGNDAMLRNPADRVWLSRSVAPVSRLPASITTSTEDSAGSPTFVRNVAVQ